MIRLPVRYKNKVLMPMKASRVRRSINEEKAKIKYDRKLNIRYLELTREPSGSDTQDITLGIDPGSVFDGFSVVSDKSHHLNIELIQRAKKGKTSITYFKGRQASARRTRRSRLRHRKIRFDNRAKNKLSPTIKANLDFRKWLINKLLCYYPITNIVVEDVKFNHYKSDKGASFSPAEQGKAELYRFIEENNLGLELFSGFDTKKLRVNRFGSDPKKKGLEAKGDKTFEAHCLDSFVLACNKSKLLDIETGEILENEPCITFSDKIIGDVAFIEKIVKVRRRLTLTRARYKDKKRYYRYGKGGIKKYFTNISNKQSKCRVKVTGDHSNHPSEWVYLDNGRSEKVKSFTGGYGGTVIKGKPKFFIDNEWQNRKMSSLHS